MSRADLDALLEQIYANPRDRSLREVYADALQAAGDPRGDFIALQLREGDASVSARELLDTHWQAWLGPLAPCTDRAWSHFAAGFLDHFTIRRMPRDASWSLLETSPIWSTVRVLFVVGDAPDSVRPSDVARIVAHAPLPAALDKLSAPHRVLCAIATSGLSTAHLVVMLDDGEPFELELALARAGRVTVQRQAIDRSDLADLSIWKRATASGCTDLELFARNAWPPAGAMFQAIATAIASDQPRPPRVTYAASTHVIELACDTFTLAAYSESDASTLARDVAAFVPALSRFAKVRITMGIPARERTIFDGDSEQAIAWLGASPGSA